MAERWEAGASTKNGANPKRENASADLERKAIMATPCNQSVLKAFAILEAFRCADEWVTCSELSRRTRLPEASAYRLIMTLVKIGAVTRGPRGRYRPGMLLLSLSQNVAVPDLLHDASANVVTDLANRLRVTVHLGILEDGMVHYVAQASTPSSFTTDTLLGCQLEAYCTSLGKILLASLPEDQLEKVILNGELVPLTRYTISNRALLNAELLEVRKRGFALNNGEMQEGMCCVAVPVYDPQKRTIASISATEARECMTPRRRAELRLALDIASGQITRNIYPITASAGLGEAAPAARGLILERLGQPAYAGLVAKAH